MTVIRMKAPGLAQKRNAVTLLLHPIPHYRLMVEVAKRKALGRLVTASDVVNEALLKQLAAVDDESTVLDNYTPRRKPGRPMKQQEQEQAT